AVRRRLPRLARRGEAGRDLGGGRDARPMQAGPPDGPARAQPAAVPGGAPAQAGCAGVLRLRPPAIPARAHPPRRRVPRDDGREGDAMIRPTVSADTPTLTALAAGTGVFKPMEIDVLREVLDDYHAGAREQGHRAVTAEHDGTVTGFAYFAPEDMTDR